jgi:hypothetical protein
MTNERKINLIKMIPHLGGVIAAIIGIWLCLHWYDWKLLLIIGLLTFSNNINKI